MSCDFALLYTFCLTCNVEETSVLMDALSFFVASFFFFFFGEGEPREDTEVSLVDLLLLGGVTGTCAAGVRLLISPSLIPALKPSWPLHELIHQAQSERRPEEKTRSTQRVPQLATLILCPWPSSAMALSRKN